MADGLGSRLAPALIALVGLLSSPAVADAQACVGRPVGGLAPRAIVAEVAHVRYDVAVGAGDPSDGARGTDAGAGYWANPGGFLGYSVSYARRLTAGADADVLGIGVLAELPAAAILPPGGGLCVTSGISGSWYTPRDPDDERRSLSIPIGVAAGLVLPVGPAARVYPFVNPRLVLTESNGGYFPRISEPAWRTVVDAGVGFARASLVGRLRFGAALGGVGASRPPIPDLRAGVEAGIRF